MKILLAKPNNRSDHVQPSLGLGYLAASVRNKHDTVILDCIKEKMDVRGLLRYIRRHKPDVLGLQCYTFDLKFISESLAAAKEANPGIVTVLGGPHPSALPAGTFRLFKGDLDYLFAGEAEAGFGLFADCLESSGKDFRRVPGLTWIEDGELRSNPKAVAQDLDDIEMPAWDLIHPEDYPEAQHGAFYRKFPIAPIMITRGCPYQCTFCAGHVVSGRKLRMRSAQNVLNEISYLYKDFGIREFHIIDDNFTCDAGFAKDFLRRLKALNLDISLAVPNGVRMDSLDKEMLKLMKDAGLYLISLGIESGSDRILADMKKSISTDKIRRCVGMIRDAGIDIAGFFILGFPTDDEASVRQTIKFSLELDLSRANFFTYLPFPGSESYLSLESKKELDGVNWEKFYFMNAAYCPKALSRKKLKKLHRWAFAKFYLRPRIIAYNIRSVKSFRHFLYLARRFLNWIVIN